MAGLGLGLSLGLNSRASAAAAYDPSVLSLTAWWRANYTGSPWAGTASAGSSGSRSLTDVGTAPAVGTAQNSKTPADFNGTSSQLRTALTLANLVNANAGSFWFVARADTAEAAQAAGSPFNNPGLLMLNGSGYMGIGYASNGVCAFLYDGAYREVTVAAATGAYFVAQGKFDGSTLKLRINGGTRSSVPAGSIADLTSTPILIGTSINQDHWFDGRILEIGVTNSTLTDTVEDNVYAAIRTTYGI